MPTHAVRRTLALAVCLLLGTAAAAHGQPPNILIIVSDDQGWNDVGYHNPEIRTPNIDALVAGGVELDCHYVQPQCTPTRVALMTGRYPSRFGPHATSANNDPSFPVGTPTLARMLKNAGYATGMSGKWHLGSSPEFGPNHHGFDSSHGSLTGAVGMYDHRYRLNQPKYTTTWHRDHEFIDEVGHVTDLTAAEAVRWIEDHEDGAPWFFYAPMHAVHTPIVEGDPKWQRMNEHIESTDRRLFAAAVSHLDWAVGEMVKALERTGQRERTLIIYTSDNGGIHGRYGGGNYPPPDPALAAGFSSNEPLRGGKTQAFEGGIRVPAFANWPGTLEPRQMTAPMHVVDWVPTIGDVIGGDGASNMPDLDGRSVWPQLTGEVETAEPRTFYWVWGGGAWRAMRHGDWKIVRQRRWASWQLYDLGNDPGEEHDRAADEPDHLAAMLEIYAAEAAKDGGGAE